MSIGSVNMNGQSFTAKPQNNKKSSKTNVGKYVGLGVGLGCIGQDIVNKGGLEKFVEDAHSRFSAVLEKEVTNSLGKNSPKIELKSLSSKALKRMSTARLCRKMAFLVGCCIAAGALLDGMINMGRH